MTYSVENAISNNTPHILVDEAEHEKIDAFEQHSHDTHGSSAVH